MRGISIFWGNKKKFNYLKHRWLFFILYLLVNAYLSYAGSLKTKLLVGFFGLVVPFLISAYFLLLIPIHQKPFFEFKNKNLNPPLNWIIFFILATGIFIRLYKIEALSIWPIWDDGYISYYATDLFEKWHWQFIFGWMHDAPLYTWIQSLFFKGLEPSVLSVWLYPIFYSILVLPLAFCVVRKYFSLSFSSFYLGFLSLSFWPILVSRFSIDVGLSLAWQYLVLWGLLPFLKSLESKKDPTIFQTILLGALIGLGWYTSKFWITTMAVFVFIAWYCLLSKAKIDFKKFLIFNATLAIFIFPFLLLLWKQGFESHLHDIFFFKKTTGSEENDSWIGLSYLTGLFWGIPHHNHFTFGPFLGGFLNPILDSVFFIGLLEIIYFKKEKGIFGIFLIGGMFLLPLLLSQSNLEMMRIFLILPFLLLVITIGCQTLLTNLPSSRKWACLTLAGLSLFLDLFQLWVPYHAWAIPENTTDRSKSLLSYQVFQVFKKAYRPPGPGFILTDFLPDVFDQTLLTATYPYNALRNPKWRPEQATWACIWVKREYEKELKRQFPESRFYRFEKIESSINGKTSLFIIPINSQNRSLLFKWAFLHRSIQSFYTDFFRNINDPNLTQKKWELWDLYSQMKSNDFLESIFWWKWMMFPAFDLSHPEDARVVESIIQKKENDKAWSPLIGNLYFHLGSYLVKTHQYSQARKAFLRAGYLCPNLMPAKEIFQKLDALVKNGN